MLKKTIFLILPFISSFALGQNINVHVDNAIYDRVINANAFAYGYQEMVSDGQGGKMPNPQSKESFVAENIEEDLKERTINYEVMVSRREAELLQSENSKTDIKPKRKR